MNVVERRRLRLRLRDLAALSAFTAVGLSGSVPVWVSVLFVLAFAISMFDRRPLARQRAWAVVALLAVAVVLFGLAFKGALDLVVAAVSFAALVTAHRLVSEPSAATDQQALLASLLLIAGAAALSGEIWFAACLLAFGVFSCLHLGLSVVEGPVDRNEDLPMGPVFRQVSLGVGLALAGGVAFFVLFPRLSWNLASRRATPGLLGQSATGMSDRVRLGGGGDLKTRARIVLRARLQPDPKQDELDRYWVGRRFDVFDGREWHGSGVPVAASDFVHLTANDRRDTEQEIEVLPAYGARTLVALEHPVMFTRARATSASGTTATQLVHVPGEEVRFAAEAISYTYVAYSRPGTWMRDDEGERTRALALPTIDPRVAALAKTIVGTETDPLRRAHLVERWLKTSLSYSLELEGEVADPLTEFLFVRKSGHCEHFATALAVLLRTLDVPARITVGFFGGKRVDDRYLIRAGDAHAWVEAWVDDRGWVTLDATPESGRGSQPVALLAMLADLGDRIEEAWRSRVVDYSFIDQVQFVRNLVRPPERAEREGTSTTRAPVSVPWRGLASAGVGLVAYLVVRRFQRRERLHPAATFLARLEGQLAQLQVPRREGEPLEELTRRLTGERHPLAPPLEQATRRYLEARFGARPLPEAEQRRLLEALRAPAQLVR